MATLIGIVIALLVAGFVLWVLRQVVNLIPMEPLFKQVVDLLILVIVVAIVLFYVIIPLLHMLPGAVSGLGIH